MRGAVRIATVLTACLACIAGCGGSDDDDEDDVDDADHAPNALGISAVSLGDLDGDGFEELLVGETGARKNRGALRTYSVLADGSTVQLGLIGSGRGGFGGDLDDLDDFGESVARIGDLDGDGVAEVAVGAPRDDDGPDNSGAVWILWLNAAVVVVREEKISASFGGFTGELNKGDRFGSAIAALGDLDGDGIADIAVGARLDDDGGEDQGAIWILFLDRDGSVLRHRKISATEGGFSGELDPKDHFGASAAALGDLDGDGVTELAVGAPLDDEGGNARGAVWVLFLAADGSVRSHEKIATGRGAFTGYLDNETCFGDAAQALGDLDGDGVFDFAVGAPIDSGSFPRGAVWVLFLRSDGTVKAHSKIGDAQGGFSGELNNGDGFGSALALLGDLDANGVRELLAGAAGTGDDEDGALWTLFMTSAGTVVGQVRTP